MFGLGFWECLLIIFLALIFLKPKQYAQYLRMAGKFTKTLSNFKTQFMREINILDSDDSKFHDKDNH